MRHILLVPSPAWRDRLLATGPCGASPPLAWERPAYTDASAKRMPPVQRPARWLVPNGLSMRIAKDRGELRRALVLAWAGAAVPEGCDRAARVLAEEQSMPTGTGTLWFADGTGRHGLITPDSSQYFAPVTGSRRDIVVTSLASPPTDIGALLPAWALATVCAARGLGEVVTVEGSTP
ncbi:MAG: hypothetical protein Q8S13_07280 [Dehalococcoidia bacterium]|nr:hypothetical protein [Dehalococcoidia bacterium]